MDSPEKGYDMINKKEVQTQIQWLNFQANVEGLVEHKKLALNGIADIMQQMTNRISALEDNLQQICNGIKKNIQEPDYYNMGFDIRQVGNSTRVSHELLPGG